MFSKSVKKEYGWRELIWKILSSVSVHNLYQNLFKFEWMGKFYQIIGMSNGYSDAIKIFTKILRPVYALLMQEGSLSVIFVDDSYLHGATEHEAWITSRLLLTCY